MIHVRPTPSADATSPRSSTSWPARSAPADRLPRGRGSTDRPPSRSPRSDAGLEAQPADEPPSWLTALRDPLIGRVLALLHDRPASSGRSPRSQTRSTSVARHARAALHRSRRRAAALLPRPLADASRRANGSSTAPRPWRRSRGRLATPRSTRSTAPSTAPRPAPRTLPTPRAGGLSPRGWSIARQLPASALLAPVTCPSGNDPGTEFLMFSPTAESRTTEGARTGQPSGAGEFVTGSLCGNPRECSFEAASLRSCVGAFEQLLRSVPVAACGEEEFLRGAIGRGRPRLLRRRARRVAPRRRTARLLPGARRRRRRGERGSRRPGPDGVRHGRG